MTDDVWVAKNKYELMMFMMHDHNSPSRGIAYEFIRDLIGERYGLTFAEVGFGDAEDFRRCFRQLHDEGYIVYSGLDGSDDFVRLVSRDFKSYTFKKGRFEDLPEKAYDITYTRHTLQHQPPDNWKVCLSSLLKAAREACVIGWRFPPAGDGHITFSGTWQNCYEPAQVDQVIAECGFELTREWHAGDDAVWVLTRKK